MGLEPGLVAQLDRVGDWGLLVTDVRLTVTGWNRWLERRSGLTAGEVLGRPLFDLFPELVARRLDRYYHQALAGQTAILSQRLHGYVLPLPVAAGGVGPDRMQQAARVVPLVEGPEVCGTLTVIEDVSERVAYEDELRTRARQQSALAAVARRALAGVDIADVAGEAADCLREILGADFTEVLELLPDGESWAAVSGSGWTEPTPPALDPATATRARQSFTAEEVQFAQALADVLGMAAERKRLEGELRLRVQELASADQRKDEFLAMLAHELRNPLAPVRNAVQVLRMKCAGDSLVERMGEMMGRQVAHMSRLVDDLLDVSRITRGKVNLRIERVELADVVARAVESARPLIDARGHELSVSVPHEPVHLHADLTRVIQVLGNLLANAAKYTPEGGHVWLTAFREGDEAVVGVRDNGIGIPAEMLPQVFDLFTQVARTLDRSQGGLGIGLTLVRSLVELHGGSVRVVSEGPGQGSEFVVRLPALPADLPRRDEQRAAERTPPTISHRILIVDDNVDSAESLAMLLGMTGHDARTAHDGPAALETALAFRPRVVLLDIGLPRMDGYEVARRLRQDPAHAGMTVIAMTGYGQEEDRRRSKEAGFDRHLVKPIDFDALLDELKELAREQS
jgi:signal transduction histidine kinase/CheY-like chemotaxis protein